MLNSARIAHRRSSAAGFEPHGYVHIAGPFTVQHPRGIKATLKREAQRAHGVSAASRIIAIDQDGSGGLLVSTSTEHLAHRLGRMLFKTYGGELHHGFGHKGKLAFVWWRC
jgi:hypothetical protein